METKIAVVCFDNIADCFVASSVNKGLKKQYPKANITWIVKDKNIKDLLSYGKHIDYVFTLDEEFGAFDLLFNLSCISDGLSKISATKKRGFLFDMMSQKYYDYLYGTKEIDMNLFQIYYRLAGMSWRGEGYDIRYYPKGKTKKSRVGLAIAHANLRNFINDNIGLESNKLWMIPYKKNVLKKMDEINRCKVIVTDDLLTLHIALSLRKFVHFLKVVPFNVNLETFNSGHVYDVPSRYVR